MVARTLLPSRSMNVERTPAGLEVRLRIAGFGRFFGAAFLSIWLMGWVVGEVVALWLFGQGIRAVLTGQPAGAGHKPVEWSVAMAAGLFLMVWLVLWTIGGVAAARELLRLLFGRDTIIAGPDGLEITNRAGILRSVKRIPREKIHRIYVVSASAPISVETTTGTVVLTHLGTVSERRELIETLTAELAIPPQTPTNAELPTGWCELLSPECDAVLVKDPAIRIKQARTTWIVCAVLASVPAYLLAGAERWTDVVGTVLFFALLAGAAACGATWLSFGRNEWKLEKGRLLLQRRFRRNLTSRFEAASLELDEDRSGDDGPTYALIAIAVGAEGVSTPAYTYAARKSRRTICSQSIVPTVPRNLGAWISQRCQIPFADLTTAEAKGQQLAALKDQLAGSGRMGQWALRVIERLETPSSRSREGRHPASE